MEKKKTGKCAIFVKEGSASSAPGKEKVVEFCAQTGDVLVGLNTGG